MDDLALRKAGAYIPYQRWMLKIFTELRVEYLELFATEKAAAEDCCKWYLRETGKTYDFDAIVLDLGQIGWQVVVCEI